MKKICNMTTICPYKCMHKAPHTSGLVYQTKTGRTSCKAGATNMFVHSSSQDSCECPKLCASLNKVAVCAPCPTIEEADKIMESLQ